MNSPTETKEQMKNIHLRNCYYYWRRAHQVLTGPAHRRANTAYDYLAWMYQDLEIIQNAGFDCGINFGDDLMRFQADEDFKVVGTQIVPQTERAKYIASLFVPFFIEDELTR